MQFFQSWGDSLKLFLPKNFKMFGLVTLKSIGMTYKTWFRYFWWAFLAMICVDYLLISGLFFFPQILFPVAIIAKFLLFVTLFLTVRPSTNKKNYSYYYGYFWHIVWIGILFLLLGILLMIMGMGVYPRVGILGQLMVAIRQASGLMFVPLFIILISPAMMFYFDTKGSFRSLVFSCIHTIKMILYNFPFYVVSIILLSLLILMFIIFFGFVQRIVALISPFLALALFDVFHIIFAVIPACFVANFYTKRLRDQSKLYF